MTKYHQVLMTHKGEARTYRLRHGLGLIALGQKETTPLQFDCRAADCGICILRVRQGAENLSPANERERDFLRAMRAADDERLACQCNVFGDVELDVEF